jgi:hypothetical protein
MLINADDQKYCITDGFVTNEAELNFKSVSEAYAAASIDLRNLKLCADLNSFKFIDYDLNENVTKIIKFAWFLCDKSLCILIQG